MNIDNDNIVPESTAASFGGNDERLDADPVDSATLDHLDNLLDEAERIHSDENTEEQPIENHEEPTEQAETGIEEQPEPLAEQVETPDAPAEQPPAVEIDPEILSIEQPRNLSEKNQNNWRKLQETATLYKKQAQEAEQLKQQLEQAQHNPSVPADYEELKKFRQIFDIKNDPEFHSKFEQPINTAKENIYGILRKHGAPDEVINSIEQAGGPTKVSDQWWQENAINKLPLTDAERLKRNLIDVLDLSEKKEIEIANAAQNAEQILAERQNQSKNWHEQETNQARDYVNQLTQQAPWARYQEIPQGATDEQIQSIKAHNDVVSGLEQKFNSALWPQNAQERASVAAAAVLSHVLTNQVRAEQQARISLEAQIKKLTEENSKLKTSFKMPKQTVSTQSTIKSSSINDRIRMNASDAIDLGLDEAGA